MSRRVCSPATLCLGSLGPLALLAFASCEGTPPQRSAPAAPRATAQLSPAPRGGVTTRFDSAIASAAAFLASSCDAQGRFAYRLHVSERGDQSEGDYNVLRHAGSLYALDQVQRARPDPRQAAAIRRGAAYLLRHHLQPLPSQPSVKVIASRTGEEVTRPLAKLGGAGLGLVALSAARRLDPSLVSLEDLQGLGRFVLFCQRPDGSFRSKRYIDEPGWSTFVSLYYPGEAILGLLRLYALDPDPAWLEAAARAAAFLARSRNSVPLESLPHDHWLLIAGAELLPRWHELERPPAPIALVRRHLDQLASLFLDVQAEVAQAGRYVGSFHASGAVCPTATRIEGLVAYAALDPASASPEAPPLPRLRSGIRSGARFLLRSQLKAEPRADLQGSFPRGCLAPGVQDPGRRGEVRVDYTQHSLSALLGAARLEAR